MKGMQTDIFTTLQEAQSWIKANSEDGCDCPACGSVVKTYKRKLNAGMAAELIRLYQLYHNSGAIYFHHSKFTTVSGGEISKLKHWGLVKEKEPEKSSGRTSGYWQITQKGKEFVTGRITVPSYVHILMNQLTGFSDCHTTIQDAIGEKFNYNELMSETE